MISGSGNNAEDNVDNAPPSSTPQEDSSDVELIDIVVVESSAQILSTIPVANQRKEAHPIEEDNTDIDLVVETALGSH